MKYVNFVGLVCVVKRLRSSDKYDSLKLPIFSLQCRLAHVHAFLALAVRFDVRRSETYFPTLLTTVYNRPAKRHWSEKIKSWSLWAPARSLYDSVAGFPNIIDNHSRMDYQNLSPGRMDSVCFEQTQPRQELNMSNNPLSSLRFLSQFPNLTILNISNSNLNNKLLLQIPRFLIRTLRELDISENRLITSISSLPDFPLLTKLNLNNTGLFPNSSQFKQCFHSLEKLQFSNTAWNSVQVWSLLEHNRAGDESDADSAAC